MFQAVQDNNLAAANLALAHGANVMAESQLPICVTGQTPLHFAAAADHLAMAKLLIEHGASIEAADSHGLTPLHFAASNLQVEMVRLLVMAKPGAAAASMQNKSRALLWVQIGLTQSVQPGSTYSEEKKAESRLAAAEITKLLRPSTPADAPITRE